jgi:hypothetical protein
MRIPRNSKKLGRLRRVRPVRRLANVSVPCPHELVAETFLNGRPYPPRDRIFLLLPLRRLLLMATKGQRLGIQSRLGLRSGQKIDNLVPSLNLFGFGLNPRRSPALSVLLHLRGFILTAAIATRSARLWHLFHCFGSLERIICASAAMSSVVWLDPRRRHILSCFSPAVFFCPEQTLPVLV